MKTQYRIAEYKDYFSVEEWNEKLRSWEEVMELLRFEGEMNCTTSPVQFRSLEEAKIYVKKLQQKNYPIYHEVG